MKTYLTLAQRSLDSNSNLPLRISDTDIFNRALFLLASALKDGSHVARALSLFSESRPEDFRLTDWTDNELRVLQTHARKDLNLPELKRHIPSKFYGDLVRGYYLQRAVRYYKPAWEGRLKGDAKTANEIIRPFNMLVPPNQAESYMRASHTESDMFTCSVCHTHSSPRWFRGRAAWPNPALCIDCGLHWRKYAAEASQIDSRSSAHKRAAPQEDSGLGVKVPRIDEEAADDSADSPGRPGRRGLRTRRSTRQAAAAAKPSPGKPSPSKPSPVAKSKKDPSLITGPRPSREREATRTESLIDAEELREGPSRPFTPSPLAVGTPAPPGGPADPATRRRGRLPSGARTLIAPASQKTKSASRSRPTPASASHAPESFGIGSGMLAMPPHVPMPGPQVPHPVIGHGHAHPAPPTSGPPAVAGKLPAPGMPVHPPQPCAVCARLEHVSQLVQCTHCGLGAHQMCYGLDSSALSESWMCDMCANLSNPNESLVPKCMLCGVQPTPPMLESPFLPYRINGFPSPGMCLPNPAHGMPQGGMLMFPQYPMPPFPAGQFPHPPPPGSVPFPMSGPPPSFSANGSLPPHPSAGAVPHFPPGYGPFFPPPPPPSVMLPMTAGPMATPNSSSPATPGPAPAPIPPPAGSPVQSGHSKAATSQFAGSTSGPVSGPCSPGMLAPSTAPSPAAGIDEGDARKSPIPRLGPPPPPGMRPPPGPPGAPGPGHPQGGFFAAHLPVMLRPPPTGRMLDVFKPTERNNWVHLVCALFMHECSVGDVARYHPVEGVGALPHWRYRALCEICHRPTGACVECSANGCERKFHVSCAWAQQVRHPPERRNTKPTGYMLGFEIHTPEHKSATATAEGQDRHAANDALFDGRPADSASKSPSSIGAADERGSTEPACKPARFNFESGVLRELTVCPEHAPALQDKRIYALNDVDPETWRPMISIFMATNKGGAGLPPPYAAPLKSASSDGSDTEMDEIPDPVPEVQTVPCGPGDYPLLRSLERYSKLFDPGIFTMPQDQDHLPPPDFESLATPLTGRICSFCGTHASPLWWPIPPPTEKSKRRTGRKSQARQLFPNSDVCCNQCRALAT